MIGSLGLGCYGSPLLELGEPIETLDGIILRIGGRLQMGKINGSISINAQLSIRDTIDFELVDFDGELEVDPGEEIALYYLGEKVFGGTVDAVDEAFPVPDRSSRFKVLEIRGVDWCQLADRRTVVEGYEPQPAEDIIADLVEDYLGEDGVTTGGIQASGITIGPVLIPYRRFSEAADEIAKLIGWDWNIDYEREFCFFERSTYVAPWQITSESRPYDSLRVHRSRDDYRNVQIVRGAKDVGATRVREFAGDSDTSTWNVEFPIGEEPDVYVNDVQKTVGIRGLDDEGDSGGFDWFWAKGETAISQNTTGTKLTSSDTLKVSYKPLIPIIVTASDYSAIADRRAVEGGSGLYEALTAEPQIEDAGLAYEYALSFLRRYARINKEVEVLTREFGLRPGHLQTISIPEEGIDDEFLITQVRAVQLGTSWQIQYRGINNESAGGWPEFFKRLARSGADFSLASERDVLKVFQAAENIYLSDADSSASGDGIDPIANDPYTTAQVGTALTGCRYEEGGQVYNRGSRIGEFTLLT